MKKSDGPDDEDGDDGVVVVVVEAAAEAAKGEDAVAVAASVDDAEFTTIVEVDVWGVVIVVMVVASLE